MWTKTLSRFLIQMSLFIQWLPCHFLPLRAPYIIFIHTGDDLSRCCLRNDQSCAFIHFNVWIVTNCIFIYLKHLQSVAKAIFPVTSVNSSKKQFLDVHREYDLDWSIDDQHGLGFAIVLNPVAQPGKSNIASNQHCFTLLNRHKDFLKNLPGHGASHPHRWSDVKTEWTHWGPFMCL